MASRGAMLLLLIASFLLHVSASAISPRSPLDAALDLADTPPRPKLPLPRPGRGGGAGRLGEAIGDLAVSIQDGLRDDKQDRSQFTQDFVAEMREKYPEYNWIICHTKHSYKFDGVKGKDWAHWHKEFDIKVGGTIGYEIYNFGSGEFTRQGDGGYLNWAYSGRVIKSDQGGRHLVFAKP